MTAEEHRRRLLAELPPLTAQERSKIAAVLRPVVTTEPAARGAA